MTKTKTIPEVDFSFVRYANCWEDGNLLVEALRPSHGKRILSIASAGDNSLTLLASGAEVVATDLNPAQLACTELRKEAIRRLEQPLFLAFSGINPCEERLRTYQSLSSALSDSTKEYWAANRESIETGFIHAGKFENYFGLFRRRILPLIHRRKTVLELLKGKEMEQRYSFYLEKWNNRRWQWLFRMFFSKRMMGRLGRDPEFFKHVEGTVAERILARTEYALTELDTSNNPYLTYILNGNFADALPDYLLPDHYKAAQENIDNLIIRHGPIDAVAEEYGADSFDGYNLSDIFEYLSPKQCEEVYGRLLTSARSKARFAYWNMLVPRTCPVSLENRVCRLEKEAKELFLKDRAFFYSRFVLEEVQ